MKNDKRFYIVPSTVNTNNTNNSDSTSTDFEYKPPNNTGIIIGLIGGVLASVGDALAVIGTLVQLNIDDAADF